MLQNDLILNKIIEKYKLKSEYKQAYMLVSNDKESLRFNSILMAKVFICPFEYKNECNACNICSRIDENHFAELNIINPVNNTIKKDSILNLKRSFNVKSVEGKHLLYIINDANTLNQSAANSILKFLEEPDSNIIAIFTTTDFDAVINTISSRCQVIRLKSKNDDTTDVIYSYTDLDEEQVNIVIDFFVVMETSYEESIVQIKEKILNTFDTKEKISSVLKTFLLIYKDILNYKVMNKFKYFSNNHNILEISNKFSSDEAVKKISFILENIGKLDYNINIGLFMNYLIIGIGELSNDRCCRS